MPIWIGNTLGALAAIARPKPVAPPTASSYYVAKTGSNSNPGTLASPWLTIQYAATTAAAGSTIYVATGSYDERVVISSAKSGTAGQKTQLIASGSVTVTGGFEVNSAYTVIDGFVITPGSTSLSGAQNVDYRGQVYVKNANVTLRNLDLHDLNYAAAICLSCSAPVANYALIEDCEFSNLPWNAVSVDNGGSGTHATDVTVSGCTVSRFGGHQAIKAYGDRWTIENTVIEGPRLTDFQQTSVYDGDGISVNYGDGTIIRNCRIYDIWSYKGYASGEHADCIQFWTGVTDLTIDSCVLGSWKPGGYDNSPGPTNAIMYGTCTTNCDVTVQNCLLLCGITAGPSLAAHAHLGAAAANTGYTVTIRLYNNTFYGNYPYNNGTNTTLVSYNNVFYAHRGSYSSADTSDYNAFMWQQWSDASYTGLQASSIWASEGSHSLGLTSGEAVDVTAFANPDVSATTNYGLTADFAPSVGSPLLGAGNPVYAPALDINGDARSVTAPTIGAFEVAHSNVNISSLSASHTAIGASLTITGSGFGATQGTSKVWFGEPENPLGFRVCTKEAASYVSWSDTSITVTVPSMSPGKAGEAGTYHRVRVEVGGVESNAADFYIDPVTTINSSSTLAQVQAVCGTSGISWNATTSTITSTLSGAYGGINIRGANVLFDGITFTSTATDLGGNTTGVVALGNNGNAYNMTFLDCTITGNMGAGGGGDYGVNAIKYVNWGACYVHDTTWAGCTINRTSRMGGEFINDETSAPYPNADYNTAFIDCVFEPCGSEPLSWGSAGSAYCLVDGCTFKGFGDAPTVNWGGGFEMNQTRYAEVRNSTFWAGAGSMWNLSCTAGVSKMLYVVNCDCDYRVQDQLDYSWYWGSEMCSIHNASYTSTHIRFEDCRFHTGPESGGHKVYTVGSLHNCSYVDYSGSIIYGATEMIGGIPATVPPYFQNDAYGTDLGTNNTLPVLQDWTLA